MALLTAVVAIAAIGLLGPSSRDGTWEAAPIRVTASLPVRAHALSTMSLVVVVENTGEETLATIRLTIARAYLDAFSVLHAAPPFHAITHGDYEIRFRDVEPGASAGLRLELEPRRPWRVRGPVEVTVAGHDPLRIPVETFVFP
jgi:hypothetical protein